MSSSAVNHPDCHRQIDGWFPSINAPAIVSPEDCEAARQQLLVKEKALTRARDALAADRPWMAVEKKDEFDGPVGRTSLLDLFEGRRQLIVACAASRYPAPEDAYGLGVAVVHDHGQSLIKTTAWTSGMATTRSSATATRCSAPSLVARIS